MSALQIYGHTTVHYPPELCTSAYTALGAYEDFCGLELNDKMQFALNTEIKGNDDGYRRRIRKENVDGKEVFHFKEELEGELRLRTTSLNDPRAVRFLNEAGTLLRAVEPLGFELAERCFGHFIPAIREHLRITLRLLLYDESNGCELFADQHMDKGLMTLPLAKSAGGLRHLTFAEHKWRPLIADDDRLPAFIGMTGQLFSECSCRALWHDVAVTPETNNKRRSALVAFVDLKDGPRVRGDKLVRNLCPPGSTYGMSFEEFATFFVEP